MAGSNHFVVNKFFFCAEVAFEAFFRAMNDVARIAHAERDGFFVRPVTRSVRAEPGGGGAVAIFARDAFGEFEGAAALVGCGVQRVAGKTFRRFFGFSVEFQDAGDAFANFTGQRLIGVAVLVLDDPGGILVLQNAAARDGFDAAVATRGGAGAGANVLASLAVRIGCRRRGVRWRRWFLSDGSSNGEREKRKQGDEQREARPIGVGGDLHSKCRTSLSVHYRLERREVNGGALSFWRRGAKRQRASIYRAVERQ